MLLNKKQVRAVIRLLKSNKDQRLRVMYVSKGRVGVTNSYNGVIWNIENMSAEGVVTIEKLNIWLVTAGPGGLSEADILDMLEEADERTPNIISVLERANSETNNSIKKIAFDFDNLKPLVDILDNKYVRMVFNGELRAIHIVDQHATAILLPMSYSEK